MGELNFTSKQCVRALLKIGFYLGNKRHGNHDKFFPPQNIADKIASNHAKFIMVPRHKELHCQGEILSELKIMGGDELVDRFKENIR